MITGAGGFVAPFVARAVRAAAGADCTIIGAAQHEGEHPDIGPIAAMDLTDAAAVSDTFARSKPTHVIHLGGVSSPTAAEADPDRAWDVNVLGALRCARALHAVDPESVFVFAGSGLIYAAPNGDAALTEADPIEPVGEYATTKAAADLALGALARRGLRIVRFRPFNHTGPGQTEDFVVPRFAAQVARIEAGQQEPIIKVGNLAARRDFLDVRDVARAYVLALTAPWAPAAVFNLASGRAESIQWVLDFLVSMARRPVRVETDPARWRAVDAPIMRGDATAASAALGWRPERPLEATLTDVLEHWRAAV